MKKKILLPLKSEFYLRIELGEKTEEYRAIAPHWITRLVKKPFVNMIKVICKDAWHREKYSDNELAEYIESLTKQFGNIFKDFDSVDFSYGYTKRHMEWECKGLSIGYGNPDWGAEKGKKYFVFELGRRLS